MRSTKIELVYTEFTYFLASLITAIDDLGLTGGVLVFGFLGAVGGISLALFSRSGVGMAFSLSGVGVAFSRSGVGVVFCRSSALGGTSGAATLSFTPLW